MSKITSKRILKEMKENKIPGEHFYIQPIKSSLYEWHFTMIGIKGTPYENGIYHGKMTLPMNYPLDPPDVYFFTPSGRFKVNTKICLSMTSYHKNNWTPAWKISTVMIGFISFFIQKGDGEIGSLKMSDEEKIKFARMSRTFKCEHCGLNSDLETIIKNGPVYRKIYDK